MDLFKEDYVKIPAEALGEDFKGFETIFGKRRGRYIFWVGFEKEKVREDERMVVEPLYVRIALIELTEDEEGNVLVKDYWYFDLNDADSLKLIERIRRVINRGFVESIFGESEETIKKSKKKKKRNSETDIMYL